MQQRLHNQLPPTTATLKTTAKPTTSKLTTTTLIKNTETFITKKNWQQTQQP
jgi:hypothetical protein